MSIFERHPKDSVGIWFEERRKLGVSDTIFWARYKPESNTLDMSEFKHANGDGMSIMLHMLKEAGIDNARVPICRESKPPTKTQLKTIRGKLKPYPKKIKWLFWKPKNKLVKNSLDTLLLTTKETDAINQKAKSLGVPVTTLILWSLNRAVYKHLMAASQEYTWFYPVNLRGALDYGTDYANYSSGFYLPVNGNITLEEMHKRVSEKLKSGEHWSNLQQAKIAKILPGFVVRLVYRLMSKKFFYAGNFSAMGSWPEKMLASQINPIEKGDLRKERWFCCAPGTKNYPISSCIMTWNGQLSLTLKLHPAIVKDHNVSIDTLCEWGNQLLSEKIDFFGDGQASKRVVSYHY